jgi:hypothetical protein
MREVGSSHVTELFGLMAADSCAQAMLATKMERITMKKTLPRIGSPSLPRKASSIST